MMLSVLYGTKELGQQTDGSWLLGLAGVAGSKYVVSPRTGGDE